MDGRIPHSRSCSTPQALEEERRLLYVAITRPRHVLTITYPIHTTTYGTGSLGKCCRFLEPIPDTDLDRIMLS
jgi:superfamily I DNA/RNA helicase